MTWPFQGACILIDEDGGKFVSVCLTGSIRGAFEGDDMPFIARRSETSSTAC
jgi:hypothetical protein